MELLVRVALALALAGAAACAWAMSSRRKALEGEGSKELRDLRVVRVLKVTDTELALLGHFASDPKKRAAVVSVQAAAMDPRGLEVLLAGVSLHKTLQNDIYSSFLADAGRDTRPYKVAERALSSEGDGS